MLRGWIMKAKTSSKVLDGAVLILSTTEGEEGFGAEAVLEELLRGWPKKGRKLLVAAPRETRLERVCSETGHIFQALSASRDAFWPNLAAIRRLACILHECRNWAVGAMCGTN